MEKITKLIPKKIQIDHKIVMVSDATFSQIIEVINKQTEAINSLIDFAHEAGLDLEDSSTQLQTIKNSIQALAHAIEQISEV